MIFCQWHQLLLVIFKFVPEEYFSTCSTIWIFIFLFGFVVFSLIQHKTQRQLLFQLTRSNFSLFWFIVCTFFLKRYGNFQFPFDSTVFRSCILILLKHTFFIFLLVSSYRELYFLIWATNKQPQRPKTSFYKKRVLIFLLPRLHIGAN